MSNSGVARWRGNIGLLDLRQQTANHRCEHHKLANPRDAGLVNPDIAVKWDFGELKDVEVFQGWND
jgi:hypothetical protein